MKRLCKLFANLIPVMMVVGVLEVALRSMPELIPIELPQHFHEEMRLEMPWRWAWKAVATPWHAQRTLSPTAYEIGKSLRSEGLVG